MAGSPYQKVLESAAFEGAFRVSNGEFMPLLNVPDGVQKTGQATFKLWAGIARLANDVEIVIAKRDSGYSIAVARGGVILETKTPVNIGIVRAALRGEDALSLAQPEDLQPTSSGARALLNLAGWIDDVEADRMMTIFVGDDAKSVKLRKGSFTPADGVSAKQLAEFVLSANQDRKPVSFSYDEAGEDQMTATQASSDLFGETMEDGAWVFDEAGTPVGCPDGINQKDAQSAFCLYEQLSEWSAGEKFEVSVLRPGGRPEVFATRNGLDHIHIFSKT